MAARICRFLVLAAVGVFYAGRVAAALPEFASTVEQLKERALDINVQAQTTDERIRFPTKASVTLYVGSQASDLRIVSARVSIDEQPPFSYVFGPGESEALDADGLYRLAHFSAAVGEHRIHAQYLIQARQGAPQDVPSPVEFTGTFLKQAQRAELELTLGRDDVLSPATLHLQTWAAVAEKAGQWGAPLLRALIGDAHPTSGRYVPGDIDDPKIRNARFLAKNGDYLVAAARLSRLQSEWAPTSMAPAYYCVLADVLVSYGMLHRAQTIAERAAQSGVATADLAAVRLRVAEAFYQRGDFDTAEKVLVKVPHRTGGVALTDWQDLQTRLLLAQGRTREAIALLRKTANDADFRSYVRYYNLGVSLLASGAAGQGVTVLDRVGAVAGSADELEFLSDKANVMVGAYFVRSGQGASAIPTLERVHLRGPFSNRALLNLGWAYLAPAGTVQTPVALGDERIVGAPPETIGAQSRNLGDHNLYQRYHLRPYAIAKLSADDDAQLKRALAVWSVLIERDPADSTVPEGMLAVGWALDRIGAHQEAAQLYTRAVKALEQGIGAIDGAQQYVVTGRWIPAVLRQGHTDGVRFERHLTRLPSPQIAPYLRDGFAERAFQDGFATYRDLEVLTANASDWERRLQALGPMRKDSIDDSSSPQAAAPPTADALPAPTDIASTHASISEATVDDDISAQRARIAALQADLAAAADIQEKVLQDQVLKDLAVQRDWRAKLLGGARFELARVYDGVMPGQIH